MREQPPSKRARRTEEWSVSRQINKGNETMRYRTLTKIFVTLLILVVIRLLRVDEVLVGENFIWTAFFILLALGLLFNSMEERDEKIRMLRYEMHNLVFGSSEEKREADSYAIEKRPLLETAKKEMTERYGSKNEPPTTNSFQNQIPEITQDLPILYPAEMQRLAKIRKIFENKSEARKAQHKHSWSPAIIPPSPATRNNREIDVCFKCGQIGKNNDKN